MTTVIEREKILTDYEQRVLPSIIKKTDKIKKTIQEITEQSKFISEGIADISDASTIKTDVLKSNREFLLKTDETHWKSFVTKYVSDCTLEGSLEQYQIDLGSIVSPVSLLAASGSTMADSSGNVRDGLFTIIANVKNIPSTVIFDQYQKDNFPENKKTIRTILSCLYPDYLSDFDDIIHDWESKQFKDMKLLIGIRSIIFENLLSKKQKSGDYTKTEWYKLNQFQSGDKHYYNAIFFMIENNDATQYPNSFNKQVIDIALHLSKIHGELSRIGKLRQKKTPDYEIELLFRETLSYTASAVKIRQTATGYNPRFQFHI
nr:hypothetical protein [uncultured Methanoregula sp.]